MKEISKMANEKVKAYVITDVMKMEKRYFPRPVIGDTDALMKVEMVSVCATESGVYTGKNKKAAMPLLPGHEVVGRIEEIGEIKSKRTGIKKGDRVVVETRFGCGVCEQCIKGNYTKCEKNMGYGYGIPCTEPPYLWGAYAEYLYVPERAILHKISEDVPGEAATLACAVLGNSVRWLIEVGGFKYGDSVVITGCGRQGLGLVVAAKEAGADKIFITGTKVDGERLAMAKRLGADYTINIDEQNPVDVVMEATDGKGVDVAVEISGAPAAAASLVDMVKKLGTIVVPALYGDKKVSMDYYKVMINELTIKGVHTHNMDSVRKSIQIIESGKYPLDELVTHHFSLDDAELAIRTAAGLVEGEHPINTVIVPAMDKE